MRAQGLQKQICKYAAIILFAQCHSIFAIFFVIEWSVLMVLVFIANRTAHAQLFEKLRPIAFVETCEFLTVQLLDFQEIWQKNCLETT